MLFQISFRVLFIQLFLARVGVFLCKNNDDCNEGYSCFNSSCMSCLKCSLLLRKGSDCVVDFGSCGECLPGYEEVLITDSSSAIKPCIRVRLKRILGEEKCKSDSSCPPDSYCHEDSCVKCFNCDLSNRLASVKGCAKDLNDCGSCKKGFTEISVSKDSKLKACQKPLFSGLSEAVVIVLAVILFCFIVIPSLANIRRSRVTTVPEKHSVVKRSLSPKLPSAPPLQTLDAPEHIIKLVEEDFSVAFTVDQMQLAKVFKQPDALYYDHEESQCVGNLGINVEHIGRLWPPLNSALPGQEERSAGVQADSSPQPPVQMGALPPEEASNQQQTEHCTEDAANAAGNS